MTGTVPGAGAHGSMCSWPVPAMNSMIIGQKRSGVSIHEKCSGSLEDLEPGDGPWPVDDLFGSGDRRDRVEIADRYEGGSGDMAYCSTMFSWRTRSIPRVEIDVPRRTDPPLFIRTCWPKRRSNEMAHSSSGTDSPA